VNFFSFLLNLCCIRNFMLNTIRDWHNKEQKKPQRTENCADTNRQQLHGKDNVCVLSNLSAVYSGILSHDRRGQNVIESDENSLSMLISWWMRSLDAHNASPFHLSICTYLYSPRLLISQLSSSASKKLIRYYIFQKQEDTWTDALQCLHELFHALLKKI
jgi:hypothetical protein